MKITSKFILFTSKTLKDGSSPIMLRLYIEKRYYYSTGLSAMPDEWDDELEQFIGKKFKKQNQELSRLKSKAGDILVYLRLNKIPITKHEFDKRYLDVNESPDVFVFFQKKIEQLKTAGKIGNQKAYQQSMAAIRSFVQKDQLKFTDVTANFLINFETFMLSRGCKSGGLAAYLRSFRALYNSAIQQGLVNRDHYPFKNQFNSNGYDMAKLKSGYNPRAMSEKDLEKFKGFDYSSYPDLTDTFKIALFIYYGRGINFTDLAYLKWTDIYSERIHYIRKKTHKPYSIKISEPLSEVLSHFRNVNDEYIFPVFNEFHKTATQKDNRLKKARKRFNKQLKEIGKILEIDVNLTSYVFRHTFATTLKRKGGSIALISEAMGHQNVEITNAYLKSFSNEEVDALDQLL